MGLAGPSPPLLQLPAARAILNSDAGTLAAIHAVLTELREQALQDAALSWKRRKAPMARYRLDTATHLAAILRSLRPLHLRNEADPRHTFVLPREAHKPRSARDTTRNPILRLRAISALLSLPLDARTRLRRLTRELAADCSARAETSWKSKRRGAAVDWRTAGVYVGHIGRALARAPPAQCEIEWSSPPQGSDSALRDCSFSSA